MRNSMFLLVVAATAAVLAVGCGEDDNDSGGGGGGAGAGEGEGEGGMCAIGTFGCGCSDSFPCVDDGVWCVDEVCVECADGAERCACKDDGTCDEGLECTNPDPGCQVMCAPSSCTRPG